MPAERKYYFTIGLNAAPRNVFVRVYVKRTLSISETNLSAFDIITGIDRDWETHVCY